MNIGTCVLTFMETTENSISERCTLNSKITEIKLLFNTPKLKDKILVIVEGITDRVYRYLFDDTKVIFEKYGSCDGITNLIESLDADFKDSFIVIKDADFDHLDKISYPQYTNFFETDTHDIETMMLSVNTIEQKLSIEFLSEVRKGFIQTCMEHLEPLSYLKWFNMKNHLNLIVKEIKLGTVYDGLRKINLKDCENELYKDKKNQERCSCVADKVSEFMKKFNTDDKWNLVNGHDLCIALNIYFKNLGKSVSDIDKCLRMAYTMNDFKKTELYNSIKKWEVLHNKIIIRKES